jgi:hypothetical protein
MLKGLRQVVASSVRERPGKGLGAQSVRPVAALPDNGEAEPTESTPDPHLRFIESLDQVNSALRGTDDLKQMMSDVLDRALSIFDCDRAWLVFPCNPNAATWRAPMERTRPAYPGALALGVDQPVDAGIAQMWRILLVADWPVKFGPGGDYPHPREASERYGIKSCIAMVLYPKIGEPWLFGLHQCSYPRVWTPEDERLFQEVARRLSDGLTTLLTFRDLQKREAESRGLANAQVRLNRSLRLLISCNQMLIHADDESALLNDVCRLIVEGGHCLGRRGGAGREQDGPADRQFRTERRLPGCGRCQLVRGRAQPRSDRNGHPDGRSTDLPGPSERRAADAVAPGHPGARLPQQRRAAAEGRPRNLRRAVHLCGRARRVHSGRGRAAAGAGQRPGVRHPDAQDARRAQGR